MSWPKQPTQRDMNQTFDAIIVEPAKRGLPWLAV